MILLNIMVICQKISNIKKKQQIIKNKNIIYNFEKWKEINESSSFITPSSIAAIRNITNIIKAGNYKKAKEMIQSNSEPRVNKYNVAGRLIDDLIEDLEKIPGNIDFKKLDKEDELKLYTNKIGKSFGFNLFVEDLSIKDYELIFYLDGFKKGAFKNWGLGGWWKNVGNELYRKVGNSDGRTIMTKHMKTFIDMMIKDLINVLKRNRFEFYNWIGDNFDKIFK